MGMGVSISNEGGKRRSASNNTNCTPLLFLRTSAINGWESIDISHIPIWLSEMFALPRPALLNDANALFAKGSMKEL
jgi:hypothetical protein